jgi:hypothetical protein
MASLQSRLADLITAIGDAFKDDRDRLDDIESIVSRVQTGAVSDDSTVDVATPNRGGMAFINCYSNSNLSDGKVNAESGIVSFDTGTGAQIFELSGGTTFDAINSVPTGTTHNDGQTNVGRDTDKLVIENRNGGTRYYSVVFIT